MDLAARLAETRGSERERQIALRRSGRGMLEAGPCVSCGGFGREMDIYPDEGQPQPAHGVACDDCHGSGKRYLDDDERWALAAYCGADWARELVPETGLEMVGSAGSRAPARWENIDEGPLPAWLSGLKHWGQRCLVIAAVAAAEVALVRWERENAAWQEASGKSAPRKAIEAAKRWLLEGTKEAREAWRRAVHYPDVPLWVPIPLRDGCTDIGAAASQMSLAAEVANEADARKAICEALLEWLVAPAE